MRLKSSKEFNAVFGNAPRTPTQQKIADELAKVEKGAKTRSSAQRSKKALSVLGKHAAPFSPLPPLEPSDLLYQRLVREWGRFHNGGEVVWELEAVPGTKLRVDAAFPRFGIAIEHDGWQFHGKYLEDFKRDRAKALKLAECGWSTIWVTKEMATDGIEETIESIRKALSHRSVTTPPEIICLPGGWSRVINGKKPTEAG